MCAPAWSVIWCHGMQQSLSPALALLTHAVIQERSGAAGAQDPAHAVPPCPAVLPLLAPTVAPVQRHLLAWRRALQRGASSLHWATTCHSCAKSACLHWGSACVCVYAPQAQTQMRSISGSQEILGYYGVPALSLRAALHHRMDEERDLVGQLWWPPDVLKDQLHPNCIGQRCACHPRSGHQPCAVDTEHRWQHGRGACCSAVWLP